MLSTHWVVELTLLFFFQAYSLLEVIFAGPSELVLLVVINIFLLCLVSAFQLRICINSYIKIIKLYYEVSFIIIVALNFDWVI